MDGKGRVYDLVYDRIESPQRVECHLAENLNESGTCKLILTTYARDEGEDARLGIYERVVSFVKFVEPTTVTKTYPTDDPDRIGKFDNEGGGQTFEGRHLAGASLEAKYTGQSGTAYDDPINASEFTVEDDRIVIAGGDGSQWAGIATSVNADYPFEVTITPPGGSKVVPLEMN